MAFNSNEDPESTIIIDVSEETLPSTSNYNPDICAARSTNVVQTFKNYNPELDAILKKYTSPQSDAHTNSQASPCTTATVVELSSDDDDKSHNNKNIFSVNPSSSPDDLNFYYKDNEKTTETNKFGLRPSTSKDNLQNIFLDEDAINIQNKFNLSPNSSKDDLKEKFCDNIKNRNCIEKGNYYLSPSSSDEDLQMILNESQRNYSSNSEVDTTSLRNFYQEVQAMDKYQKPLGKLCTNNSDDDKEKLTLEGEFSDKTEKNASQSSDSPKAKKKRQSKEDKERRRAERELQKAKKHEENERAKKFKQLLAKANKNIKPEECMKFMAVHVDSEFVKQKYSNETLKALEESESSFEIHSQVIPCTITWTRKVQTHFMDDKENLVSAENITETDTVVLVMDWKLIIDLVHSRTLITHIKSIQSMLINKKLSLAIFGLENYFKYLKSKKRTEWQDPQTQKPNKYDKIYQDVPKIYKKTVQFALTELQLLCSCSHRMVETPQDLSAMILQYTKSIAQIPYKLEKHRSELQASWYMCGDKKDTVKVDKNGNGLQRLWKQQLTTFPLARLETAEAIMTQYPTPTALMNAYSRCDQVQGEKLLQDIQIRRAAGPLTSVKRIGPELSKKMYKFFTSDDGNTIL